VRHQVDVELANGGRDSFLLAGLGEEAPDFTLDDLDGRPVKLSDQRGSRVVLQWFNPLCPFTRHAHSKGLLSSYIEEARAAGVIWLAINSAADRKMGGDPETNRAALAEWGADFPVLLDPDGRVGRRFDATTTPEVFVIDEHGTLVYIGALDNAPFGKPRGGGEVVNYVAQVLRELDLGETLSAPYRQSYGCRVKYAQPTLGQ